MPFSLLTGGELYWPSLVHLESSQKEGTYCQSMCTRMPLQLLLLLLLL